MIRRILGITAVITACAFGAIAAHAQQFVMRISSPTINDATQEWALRFKKGVEERSHGRIKVQFYPANQLGQIPATVEGVALGTIQMTLPATGFLVSLDKRFQVFDAPGLFTSVAQGEKVLDDPAIRKRLANVGEAKGVEPLITFLNGPLMVLAYKPIRTLADFSGQKIRVPGAGPLQSQPFEKLGVSAISMPLGEVLPAMQNHTVDGLIAAFTVFTGFKYYDIAKDLTYLPQSFLVASGIVNRDFMKSLGPELEGIVRDEARKDEDVFRTWAINDLERIRKEWAQHGGKTITLSPDETKKFLTEVNSVVQPIVGADPQLKADYDAIRAVSEKFR
jgi:TRAP-type transport system periplasmic protein